MALTLLVVDDDSVDREAVRRALHAARVSAHIVEAASVAEAQARLDDRIDCILLDFQLPDGDGLSWLQQLRAVGSSVPVIALTGQGDEQTAVAMMKAGAADYLSKSSLTPERLELSVRHALALAASERERRDLLDREQLARQEAQRANRVKDEFLATLSHELRTPLNAILGWTRLLATQQLDEETTRRGFATIERNVALQIKLIEDLLDISRIETGKLVVDRQAVLLSSIVSASVESQRLAAETAGIAMRASVQGEEQAVVGDSTRLQQVLTNLLSNAIKFTPRGGSITIDLVFGQHEATLSVRDTGNGIAPEFLPRVFERFLQGTAAPTGQRAGLGLGLAIVKRLVEAHGGEITAESAGPGLGATFSVRLPTVGLSVAEQLRPAPESVSLHGVVVLLVDDDGDSRELTTEVLRRAGAEVMAAATATDAIAIANHASFDVVLSDLAMPQGDGYALIRELRDLRPDRVLAAAALTAAATAEERRRALAAGFLAHLSKPCEPTRMVSTVAMLAELTKTLSAKTA